MRVAPFQLTKRQRDRLKVRLRLRAATPEEALRNIGLNVTKSSKAKMRDTLQGMKDVTLTTYGYRLNQHSDHSVKSESIRARLERALDKLESTSEVWTIQQWIDAAGITHTGAPYSHIDLLERFRAHNKQHKPRRYNCRQSISQLMAFAFEKHGNKASEICRTYGKPTKVNWLKTIHTPVRQLKAGAAGATRLQRISTSQREVSIV